MSMAFLEGAEYAFATQEETVMTIDYAERYNLERLAQGDEDLILDMRNDFIAAIDELRSTIAAQQDTVNETVQSLEASNTGLWMLLNKKDAHIAELETQLAAALVTIERTIFVEYDEQPDDYTQAESHTENIVCPQCNHIEQATVLHTHPWHSYVHTCAACGYIIMESEWQTTAEMIASQS